MRFSEKYIGSNTSPNNTFTVSSSFGSFLNPFFLSHYLFCPQQRGHLVIKPEESIMWLHSLLTCENSLALSHERKVVSEKLIIKVCDNLCYG